MRRLLCVGAALMLVSCGGSSSPTTPTPQVPDVAGSYSGTATFTFAQLNAAVGCPASTSVTQSGASVTFTPIVVKGACGNMTIPLGATTIDTAGAIDPSGSKGSFYDSTCGGTYNFTGGGGFTGREFRLSLSATSTSCLNFTFSTVMTR